MKHWLTLIALTGLLAGTASARIGERVDPKKRADANGKYADLPMLDMKSLDLPVVPQGTAPASRERRRFDKRIGTTTVEMQTLEFDKVETTTQPQPRANFTTKRPVNTSRRIATENVSTSAADISKTRIDAGSAEGQQDLKERLNRRP
jgi:hypothetical protein